MQLRLFSFESEGQAEGDTGRLDVLIVESQAPLPARHGHGFFFGIVCFPFFSNQGDKTTCTWIFLFPNQGDLGLHKGDLGVYTHEFLFFIKPRRPRSAHTWIFFLFKPRRPRTTWAYIYNRLTCGRAAGRAGAAAVEGRALLWYSPEFVRTLNIPTCCALEAVL